MIFSALVVHLLFQTHTTLKKKKKKKEYFES